MKPYLRGIFLTSNNAEATAAFYRDVLGIELEQVGSAPNYVYWKVDTNNLQIAIHDAESFAKYSHPSRYDSNTTHLYFKIESQADFLAHLKLVGVSPTEVDDVVVTIRDPDGRMVLLGTA